jgi:hypothetical protein
LRATQNVGRLADAAGQAQRGAADIKRAASDARVQLSALAPRGDAPNLAQERTALDALLTLQRDGDRSIGTYAAELSRETNASLIGYQSAIAQRNQRAYAARQQQLREKELTLAFDLARASAGKRLMLRLKLQNLHLDRAARAKLEGRLAALDAAEQSDVAAVRRRDAAVLAAYRSQLLDAGERADAQMSGELRAKATANFAIRRHVHAMESSSSSAMSGLPAQIAAFQASYPSRGGTAGLAGEFRSAGSDLSRRFAGLASVDRRSRSEIAAQIARLETQRGSLYRSIVAQIVNDAKMRAREHHLARVEFSEPRPDGSTDLTAAVRADLAGF